MNAIFAFNFAAMVLLLYILSSSFKSRKQLVPVLGMLAVFAFHCLYFRSSCFECSPSNPICTAELTLFWLFAALGLYMKKKGG